MPRISTDNYDTVASWNGSQDLFIVEQPDGTKVATPAMVRQYVLNNMDEVPTQDSNNPVKSGGIFSTVDDIYSVMGQNGAKNLIPYPYHNMSNTVRGITWSDNGDGGIVGNGTGTEASAQPYCDLNGNARDLLLKANTWYTLTCKRTSPFAIGANIYFLDPTTMQQTTITFDVIYGDSAQTTNTKNNVFMYNAGVVSEEVKFKLSQDMYAQVQVRYKAGTNVTVSNDVQYPMLRLASDTDNTYEPYAMTNKQLTDAIGDLSQTGLTGDSVAEQLGSAKTYVDNAVSPKINKTAIQMGRAVFPPAAVGVQTVAVTFPTAFTHKPQVMVTWDDNQTLPTFFKYPLNIANITTTGFTVKAERLIASEAWYFRYIAVDNQ